MTTYIVYTTTNIVKVKADSFNCENGKLILMRDKIIVACFASGAWLYMIKEGDNIK